MHIKIHPITLIFCIFPCFSTLLLSSEHQKMHFIKTQSQPRKNIMPKSPRRQTLSPIKKQPHNSFINEERIKPPSPRQTQSSKLQSSKPLEKITEEKIIEE